MATEAMKKILLLNGSPRREASTTLRAARAVVQGMLRVGGYTCEEVHVRDLRVHPCTGCLSCWGRTEGECVLRDDDIPVLKEKILAADVVFNCYPLYFFGMPGMMKTVTDRLLSMVRTYHGQDAPPAGEAAHELRYPGTGRKFLLLSTCAFTQTEVYEPLRRQYDLICGRENYTAIFCPQFKTMADYGGARLTRALARLSDAGEEFLRTGTLCQTTQDELSRPPFSPQVYRTVLARVWDGERAAGMKDNQKDK